MLLTELPAYLYHNAEFPERGDGALFHFTKWDNLKFIMNDLTLLPSSFGKLNDMNEANVHNMNMNKNFMVMYMNNADCFALPRTMTFKVTVRKVLIIQLCGHTMLIIPMVFV